MSVADGSFADVVTDAVDPLTGAVSGTTGVVGAIDTAGWAGAVGISATPIAKAASAPRSQRPTRVGTRCEAVEAGSGGRGMEMRVIDDKRQRVDAQAPVPGSNITGQASS